MSTIALFVGNLPINFSQEQLEELFSPYQPTSVSSAPGRNFAYVELPEDQVEDAISNLNGSLMGNHMLVVKRADYMEPRTAKG